MLPDIANYSEPSPTGLERKLWLFAAAAGIACGIYFRLIGLAAWPLATDEYYLFRSITFITESGLPAFPCGGYYSRGLLSQYLTAPLLVAGMSPELALRLIPVLTSLAALAAAGWLAFKVGGLRLMSAILVIMSLSTWEIEMSRFGRMYAPFQAIFLFYLYQVYRLLIDADEKRWRWLFVLSIVAPFVWEGGVLLPIANILVMLMRQCRWRPIDVVGAVVVLFGAILFLGTDFRFMGQAVQTETAMAAMSPGVLGRLTSVFPLPVLDIVSTRSGAVFVLAGAVALAWGFYQSRPIISNAHATIAMLAVAVSTVIGQLLLAVLLLVGAMLAGWLTIANLRERAQIRLLVVVALIASAWAIYAIAATYVSGTFTVAKSLMSFPEPLYSLVYPWFEVMPIITLLVFSGTVALTIGVLLNDRSDAGLRGLLVIVIAAVTVVGGAQTLYSETRYSFHLYPLFLILSIVGISFVIRAWKTKGPWLHAVAASSVLIVFIASQDFAASHLRSIDSYSSNFRVGLSDRMARHYFPRFDFRSPADFVNANANGSDTIIATNVVVTEYLDRVDYVYMNQSDRRFRGQVCSSGDRERWTGEPLLSQTLEIDSAASDSEGTATWLIVDWQTMKSTLSKQMLSAEWGFEEEFQSPDKRMTVFYKARSTE